MDPDLIQNEPRETCPMLVRLAAAFTLAFGIVLVACPDAPAQLPGSVTQGAQVPGMTMIPLGRRTPDAVLLTRPTVQLDLKLTPEQKKKVERLDRDRLDRARLLDQSARAVNQNEFSPLPVADLQSFQEGEAALNDDVATSIAQILSPRQRQRLAQVSLQVEGAMAFSRDELLQRLNVDEQQMEAIRTILQGSYDELGRNAYLLPRENPMAAQDVDTIMKGSLGPNRKADALVAQANGRVLDGALRKIAGTLRKKQWETYTRLKGEPFDLARLNLDETALAASAKETPTATDAKGPPADARVAEPKAPARKTLRQKRSGDGGGN